MKKKKTIEPIQLKSESWYVLGIGSAPFYEECCDCGLVHKISYKIENGRIFVNYARHDRETAKARKRRNQKE